MQFVVPLNEEMRIGTKTLLDLALVIIFMHISCSHGLAEDIYIQIYIYIYIHVCVYTRIYSYT